MVTRVLRTVSSISGASDETVCAAGTARSIFNLQTAPVRTDKPVLQRHTGPAPPGQRQWRDDKVYSKREDLYCTNVGREKSITLRHACVPLVALEVPH
jgi:hypothetical protein